MNSFLCSERERWLLSLRRHLHLIEPLGFLGSLLRSLLHRFMCKLQRWMLIFLLSSMLPFLLHLLLRSLQRLNLFLSSDRRDKWLLNFRYAT